MVIKNPNSVSGMIFKLKTIFVSYFVVFAAKVVRF